MFTTLTVHAGEQSLWLCFEPWANEYTVAPNTTVVVHFDDKIPLEVVHHPDGMTFWSMGRHPDVHAEDGSPLEMFSDFMPVTPDGPLEALKYVAKLIPPR